MLQPRPYQTEALNAVMQKYKDGVKRQLVSLPTGCGKTIIFGLVAEAMKTRTLVLAHREELLQQARQKIKLVYPDADMGILQADEHSGLNSEICIASVQTAIRHTVELAQRGFNLLICDEAHHAVSNSYKKIFQELGFMSEDSEKLLLGVTATAFRGDNAGLGAVFQDIVFERSIETMIKGGYLCPPRGIQVGTDINISNVKVRHGDFNVGELEEAINTDARNDLVVKSYLDHGENRHGVIFAVSVKHAQSLAECFDHYGITCEAVYGDMPKDKRQDVLARYENHELQLLTNVGVLTEGWDVPDTDIILMARPTKSKTLYIQCIGRGLRLAPGKTDCLIMDFTDNTTRYNICTLGSLFGKDLLGLTEKKKKEEEEDGEEHIERERSTHWPLRSTTQEIDLFDKSHFVWDKVETKEALSYKLSFMDGSACWCIRTMTDEKDSFKVVFVSTSGKEKELSTEKLPLGYAMGTCEDYARRLKIGTYSQKDAAWRTEPATEKQISALKRLGIDFNPDITKGEANDLLNQKMGIPATEKQIWFILHNNLHPNPKFLTKAEAGRIINEYKKIEAV